MATAILLASLILADVLDKREPKASRSIFQALFGLLGLAFCVAYDIGMFR